MGENVIAKELEAQHGPLPNDASIGADIGSTGRVMNELSDFLNRLPGTGGGLGHDDCHYLRLDSRDGIFDVLGREHP